MDSLQYAVIVCCVVRILDKHDEILLQEDLDSLVDWTKKWCLQLNIDKYKILKVAHSGCTKYKLDGVPLQ